MSRFIVLISLFFTTLNVFSQAQPNSALFPSEIDSIRLNVWFDRNKELLLPGQDEEFKLLKTTRLSEKDQNNFLKKIQKNSSYAHGRALLTHHSLAFHSYSKGKEVLKVEISTLTRNITIHKDSEEGFYGKISKKMGNYLVKLLVRLGMFEELNAIGDTEGIM